MATRSLLSRIQLAMGWLFAASTAAFAVGADFTVPYHDDWGFLANVSAPLSAAVFLQQVNEHVVPLPWLLTWIHYAVEGAVGPLMLISALGFQTAGVVIVIHEIRRRWADDVETSSLVSGTALVLLCFAYQLQSFVFDAAVMFPMVQAFAVAAISAHLTALEATSPAVRRRWRAMAFAASLGAALSTTNGLAVPWVLVLMSVLHRERLRDMAPQVGLGIVTVLAYAATAGRGSGFSVEHPPNAFTDGIAFFLAFPASFLAYLGSGVAVGMGALVVAAGAAALWAVARSWREAPRAERFAAGLLLFAAVNGAMLAAGRAGFGVIQVAQSRYATWILAGWAALLIVGHSRWTPSGPRGRLCVAAGAVACAVALAPVQIFSGLVWLAKADHVATARLALVVGVSDAEWIGALGTHPREIEGILQTLTQRRDPSVTDSRLGQPMGVSVGKTCAGRLSMVRPTGATSGWRVVGSLDEPARTLVVADRDGSVRGVAKRAPISPLAEPQPLDVVRAVASAFRSSSGPSDSSEKKGWIGFSQDGAGPPYVAYATTADGAVCRLDVVLDSAEGS